MAKESEQKFLVTSHGWRKGAGRGCAIRQFYLTDGPDRSVRVRIKDDATANLTLKFGTPARVRDEFEYELPLADAVAMQAFALGSIISKTRYVVFEDGLSWEVDEFAGPLGGLVLAEIESEREIPAAERPEWVGVEVTDLAGYYNLSLALNGLPEVVA